MPHATTRQRLEEIQKRLGLKPDGRLSVVQRIFPRCMGLGVIDQGQTLWMTSQFQVWRLENVVPAGQTADGYDRRYVPQVGYVTGDKRYVMCDDIPIHVAPPDGEAKWEESALFIDKDSEDFHTQQGTAAGLHARRAHGIDSTAPERSRFLSASRFESGLRRLRSRRT